MFICIEANNVPYTKSGKTGCLMGMKGVREFNNARSRTRKSAKFNVDCQWVARHGKPVRVRWFSGDEKAGEKKNGGAGIKGKTT
jgi:hypothetical protein